MFLSTLFFIFNLSCRHYKNITKLEPIKGLINLKCIELTWVPIPKEEFTHMAGWISLEKANLWGCHINSEGLQTLGQFPNLVYLDLGCCDQIADVSWFNLLSGFPALKQLSIQNLRSITSDMLRPLLKVTTLEKINVNGCRQIQNGELSFFDQNKVIIIY